MSRETVHHSICVSATAPLSGGFQNVNQLEEAISEASRAAGRELYVPAFAALREA